MKFCKDIDDYHSYPRWDCSDAIERFVDIFPDIKFTVFLTPYMKRHSIFDYPVAIERLVNLIKNNNVEVFLHGLTYKKIINGDFRGYYRTSDI